MNGIEIPNFVGRGLATMGDPTTADPYEVRYATESDLRDAMAALWWLCGWDVRTEVKVPSCGRIDVLAQLRNHTVIIEMKKEILTTTQARQAFQQAHAYWAFTDAVNLNSRVLALELEQRPRVHAFVCAGRANWKAAQPASDAYREVTLEDFASLAERAYRRDAWLFCPPLDLAERDAGVRRARLQELAQAARAAELLLVRDGENASVGAA